MEWFAVDSDSGESSTHALAAMGGNLFAGGYTSGSHVVLSTTGDTHTYTDADDTTMDFHITQFNNAGAPMKTWNLLHSTDTTDYLSDVHKFKPSDGNVHISVTGSFSSGSLTLPDGTVLTNGLDADKSARALLSTHAHVHVPHPAADVRPSRGTPAHTLDPVPLAT